MARIPTKLGVAGCAVAAAASLASVARAQAAPVVAPPAAPVAPLPTQTDLIGNAINQIFGSTFVDLLNPPLQPVMNMHLGDLTGLFALFNFFNITSSMTRPCRCATAPTPHLS
jgi:hypothetical protein